MKRTCGSCDVCCVVPEITHQLLNKPANTVCPNLDQSKSCQKCLIYKTRPEPCSTFLCSWIIGFGSETDQPNQNNLLTTVRTFNNGTWVVAVELAHNAVLTTGRDLLIELSTKYDTAIIIQSYNSKIHTGDKTIIKNSLLDRAKSMTGDLIEWLDKKETIGLYKLINSAA